MKTNGHFKIERGIPMPHSGRGRPSELTATLAKMKVGESIFVPRPLVSVGNSARQWAKVGGHKHKFSLRTEGKGARIWRTE